MLRRVVYYYTTERIGLCIFAGYCVKQVSGYQFDPGDFRLKYNGMGKFGPLPEKLTPGVYCDAGSCSPGFSRRAWKMNCDNWQAFHVVVHGSRRAFFPGTILVAAKAAKFIRSLQPGIVHFDETWTRAAWIFPLLGRTPIVTSIHDIEEHPGDAHTRVQMVRRLAWRYVSHLLFYSKYCGISLSDEQDLPRLPTSVVHLGSYKIFSAWSSDSVGEERQTILFFGRLSLYKGLETLLDVAPLIAREIPNVRFVIAGSPVPGYKMPSPPIMPHGSSIEMVTQFVNPELLCKLFSECTIVVLPYISATQSGVVSTAYAFEKPVICYVRRRLVRSSGGWRYRKDSATETNRKLWQERSLTWLGMNPVA